MTGRKGQQGALFAPPARGSARVRRMLDVELRAREMLGHLEPVDEGLKGIVRSMADAIDRQAVAESGSDWTVIMGCKNLADVLFRWFGGEAIPGADDGVDVELATLVAAIRDAARP